MAAKAIAGIEITSLSPYNVCIACCCCRRWYSIGTVLIRLITQSHKALRAGAVPVFRYLQFYVRIFW